MKLKLTILVVCLIVCLGGCINKEVSEREGYVSGCLSNSREFGLCAAIVLGDGGRCNLSNLVYGPSACIDAMKIYGVVLGGEDVNCDDFLLQENQKLCLFMKGKLEGDDGMYGVYSYMQYVGELSECNDSLIDGTCNDFFGFKRAYTSKNKEYCLDILDNEERDFCLGVVTKDVSLCPPSRSIESCEFEFDGGRYDEAINLQDIKLCGIIGDKEIKNACVASIRGDLAKCEEVRDSKFKVSCYTQIAEWHQDINVCDLLKGEERLSCYSYFKY